MENSRNKQSVSFKLCAIVSGERKSCARIGCKPCPCPVCLCCVSTTCRSHSGHRRGYQMDHLVFKWSLLYLVMARSTRVVTPAIQYASEKLSSASCKGKGTYREKQSMFGLSSICGSKHPLRVSEHTPNR